MVVKPLLLAIGLATSGLPINMHPVHAAKIELATTVNNRVVVTLYVYAEDFPPGKDLNAIDTYLKKTFMIRDVDGAQLELRPLHARRLGKKLKITLCSPGSAVIAGGKVAVTILQEVFEDQVDVLVHYRGNEQDEYAFTQGDRAVTLR